MRSSIALVSMVALSISATALMAGDRVDNREAAQKARITQGIKDGSITRGEAVRLRSEQRHINRSERRVNADGVVTPAEKLRLEKEQNRASRDIYRQKHDNQARGEGRIEARQEMQKDRIKDGIKDGELTKEEAKGLIKEERKIERVEDKASADGALSPAERARIEKLQDNASKDIHAEKHDGEVRPEAVK